MTEVESALKIADEQMDLAEALDEWPAAASAQRTAIYTVLRELLLEVHALRMGRSS
jgi:hypothetical protein